MRKIFCILFLTFFLFLISGCNKQPKDELLNVINTEVQAKSVYTSVSYQNYISKLENAQLVERNPFASIKTINNATHDLKSAIENLEIATMGVFELDFEFNLLSNNSVGNDWQKSVACNGQEIKSGDTITVPLGSCATINGYIVEIDNFPDRGNCTLFITLNEYAEGSELITVQENHGRYCGNVAVWELICTSTLIELI